MRPAAGRLCALGSACHNVASDHLQRLLSDQVDTSRPGERATVWCQPARSRSWQSGGMERVLVGWVTDPEGHRVDLWQLA
jgi:hypothetical protein